MGSALKNRIKKRFKERRDCSRTTTPPERTGIKIDFTHSPTSGQPNTWSNENPTSAPHRPPPDRGENSTSPVPSIQLSNGMATPKARRGQAKASITENPSPTGHGRPPPPDREENSASSFFSAREPSTLLQVPTDASTVVASSPTSNAFETNSKALIDLKASVSEWCGGITGRPTLEDKKELHRIIDKFLHYFQSSRDTSAGIEISSGSNLRIFIFILEMIHCGVVACIYIYGFGFGSWAAVLINFFFPFVAETIIISSEALAMEQEQTLGAFQTVTNTMPKEVAAVYLFLALVLLGCLFVCDSWFVGETKIPVLMISNMESAFLDYLIRRCIRSYRRKKVSQDSKEKGDLQNLQNFLVLYCLSLQLTKLGILMAAPSVIQKKESGFWEEYHELTPQHRVVGEWIRVFNNLSFAGISLAMTVVVQNDTPRFFSHWFVVWAVIILVSVYQLLLMKANAFQYFFTLFSMYISASWLCRGEAHVTEQLKKNGLVFGWEARLLCWKKSKTQGEQNNVVASEEDDETTRQIENQRLPLHTHEQL